MQQALSEFMQRKRFSILYNCYIIHIFTRHGLEVTCQHRIQIHTVASRLS